MLVSLSLAAIAAWFSIAGLIAIFSSAATSIAVMAGVLELGKLVTASWLYRNWKIAPFALKSYLTTAVIVLMLITSMGIFGFLSKAHLDQNLAAGDAAAELQRYELRIDTEQRRINAAQKQVDALDTAIEQWIEQGYMTRAIRAQTDQQEKRDQLEALIMQGETNIADIRSQMIPLQDRTRDIEAKVGPLKYVAELVYGESGDDALDKAVRYLILALVMVFDPLAVLLLIAANFTLLRHGVDLEGLETDSEFTAAPVKKN